MSTQFTYKGVQETLQNGIHSVIFTKADGSKREMNCTLSEDLVPVTAVAPANTGEVLAVFDTDKDGWRSFRIDKIIDVV